MPVRTTSYVKVQDIGTFTKQQVGSTIEVTFNGRIYVGSITSGNSGAIFELRVDDTATSNGRARATLRSGEEGGDGTQTSMTGIFTGLGAGTHMVSMWSGAIRWRDDRRARSRMLGHRPRCGQRIQIDFWRTLRAVFAGTVVQRPSARPMPKAGYREDRGKYSVWVEGK